MNVRDAKPKVLSFCRAYLVDDFRANLAPLADQFDVHFLCDGRNDGTDDTRALFYANLASGARFTAINDAERVDVLMRCRLLRNLKPARAERLLNAMGLALETWFDKIKPSIVLCHMVDEYVTHLLSLLCLKRGIRYVGYAGSFFPGRLQLTNSAYGHAFNVREPSEAEIDETTATLLRKGYRQNYNQPEAFTLKRHISRMIRYRVKLAYFWLKGLLEKDPDNVHYLITPFLPERKYLSAFPSPKDFDTDWREQLYACKTPIIYLPLGFFPESTIDYWISDRAILDYENITLRMARTLCQSMTVVAKEHPHMIGIRSPDFYKQLNALPNLVIVPPLEFSGDVMEAVNGVVLGAGSGGVEATLRGKPVFSYSDSSYWFKSSGATYLPIDEMANWPAAITHALAAYRAPDDRSKRDMIRQCLRSTIRSVPGGRVWPLCDPADLRAVLQTGLLHQPKAAAEQT